MSFIPQPPSPPRPNRCQLFGPASRPELFEKMAASAADVINIDLEDSVAPAEKPKARENAIQGINDVDWGNKTLSLRINGLDSEFWYRDVVDVLEQTGERLDLIMIPKVGRAADLYAVDALVTSIEMAKGRKKRLAFELIIETAAGIANVVEIGAGSPRTEAMTLGVADYAASLGMRVTGIGGAQADYSMLADADDGGDRASTLADPWHYPIVQMVAACRMHGILPVDGPFGDFSDPDGYRAQAMRSATLGCVGKWAIHPSQVAIANEVFTPAEAVYERAKNILQAMKEAEARGEGAAVLDGKMIDIASCRQAEVIVRQMEAIQAAGG